MRALLVLLVTASTVLLGGCSGALVTNRANPEGVRTLSSVDPGTVVLPEDPADPVLVLDGPAVTNTNDGDRLLLDLATLEQLPQAEITVHEPFQQDDLTFTGTWLSHVLDFAGATHPVAVDILALDDYAIEMSGAEVEGGGAFLALRRDGEAIPISDFGPTRVVFPDDNPIGDVDDRWIWSVERITVE